MTNKSKPNLPPLEVNPTDHPAMKGKPMTDVIKPNPTTNPQGENPMTDNPTTAEATNGEPNLVTHPEGGNPMTDNPTNGSTAVPPAKTIDFNAIRSRDFADPADVTTLVTRVPVRRPNGHTFVRVHPGPDYRFPVDLIELPDEEETYLIYSNEVAAALDEVRKPCMLYTAITRQGTVFLWPVKLPRGTKKVVTWHTSATAAAERAMKDWVRINADMELGAYKITVARGAIPDPEWPNLTFEELLRIAFRDRLVDSLTHPLVRRYLGDA
jgi:hypothetical protein